MQRLNKLIIKAIIAAVMVLPVGAVAQNFTSSVNTYSPYSMYGMGELATPGNVAMRSMGGAGVAMYSFNSVNLLNPAGYANMMQQSFIFNFGIDAGHYRNEQAKYAASSSKVESAYNSMNIHDIAFQMPLAKNIGFGFSLTPYSNVGYNMLSDDMSSDIVGNVGRMRYRYYGEGDISEVKAGVGWRPHKKISVGVAMLYYWGNIERNYRSELVDVITGDGSYSSTIGKDTYGVSKVKVQFGVQYHAIYRPERILSFGATYDLGGDLDAKVSKYIYVDNFLASVVRDVTDHSVLRLPQQIAFGSCYQTPKIKILVDYIYQNWGSENTSVLESDGRGVAVAYEDTNTVKFGFEIKPQPSDVRRYYNRIAYRLGARYGGYYHTFGGCGVKQYAFTAGLGLPVKLFGNSSVDVGFEMGMRCPDEDSVMVNGSKVGLVDQTYYKLAIGFTLFGEDEWFKRRKFH